MTTTKKVFTRVVTVIFIIALLIFSFATCSSNTSTGTDSATSVTDPAPGLKFVEYPSISPVFDNEYSKMSEEEKGEYKSSLLSAYFNALEAYYPQDHLEINADYSSEHNLYYPVEFQEEVRTGYSSDFLIGVDENGYLKASWLSNVDFSSAIVVEESLEEYQEIVLRSTNCWIVYNTLSGELLKYHLINGEDQIGFVPKGSKYVGASNRYDLYFQSEDKVYQMDTNGSITLLAENVDYVIDCDYDLTVDAPSEPLFMMEDGSVKSYLYYKDGGSLVDPRDYRDYLK